MASASSRLVTWVARLGSVATGGRGRGLRGTGDARYLLGGEEVVRALENATHLFSLLRTFILSNTFIKEIPPTAAPAPGNEAGQSE